MPDLLWMIGLAIANEHLMLPIGIGYGFMEGFYRKQWKPIVWLLLLLAISVIMSEILKSIFKIPLVFDPKRYGFPSGHTQFAMVFYGWIAYQLGIHASRYLHIMYTIITACLLVFAVTAIVHCGYHTWFDIIGGFVSGSILLLLGITSFRALTLSKPKDL